MKAAEWWKDRRIPSTRNCADVALKKMGIPTTGILLADNLALSLNDCYWIKPLESDLMWEAVSATIFAARRLKAFPCGRSFIPGGSVGQTVIFTKCWSFGKNRDVGIYSVTTHSFKKHEIEMLSYIKTESVLILQLCPPLSSLKKSTQKTLSFRMMAYGPGYMTNFK